MITIFRLLAVFSVLILGSPRLPTLWAEEGRTGPIDVYLLIDGSSALADRNVAENWVCSTLVDGILREGDHVTLWAVDQNPQPLWTLQLGKGQDTAVKDKETLKNAILSIARTTDRSNYGAALRQASELEAQRPDRRPIAFALLIFGVGEAGNKNADRLTMEEANSAEFREFLRYSKTEDFPGWKAIVVGLGIGPRVREAAAEYMAATVGKR